jgi:hypothetical protein
MTEQGLQMLVEAGLTVWQNNPEVLEPVAGTFGVDIEERLTEPRYREGLTY